jgi:hypothetical protein
MNTIPSPPQYTNSLHNWKAEPLCIFKILGHYLPPILCTIAIGADTPLTPSAFMAGRPIRSTLRSLYSTQASLAHSSGSLPTVFQGHNRTTTFHQPHSPLLSNKTFPTNHKSNPCVTPVPLWQQNTRCLWRSSLSLQAGARTQNSPTQQNVWHTSLHLPLPRPTHRMDQK